MSRRGVDWFEIRAEAERLGLINHMVAEREVVAKACAVALDLAGKPGVAWARTKARFRELALDGFDEAFRAAVLGSRRRLRRASRRGSWRGFWGGVGVGGIRMVRF